MKISIIGEDTLAAAVAECAAEHFEIYSGTHKDAEIVWVCHDIPIDDKGVPNSGWVMSRIRETLRDMSEIVDPLKRPLILVSSQMPVGTTMRLEKEYPAYSFAHSPENIRVATAIADFRNQARVVVGVRNPYWRTKLEELFTPFTKHIIFTDPETAEMVKHALNTFLGLQIAFINEVSRIASVVGADMETITLGLRTDFRVGEKAPLRAGKPFGGGHLARDIFTLSEIARINGIHAPIINHITESNEG